MSIATRMMILQNRGPTDFDVVGSTYSNADVPVTNRLARSSLEGEDFEISDAFETQTQVIDWSEIFCRTIIVQIVSKTRQVHSDTIRHSSHKYPASAAVHGFPKREGAQLPLWIWCFFVFGLSSAQIEREIAWFPRKTPR